MSVTFKVTTQSETISVDVERLLEILLLESTKRATGPQEATPHLAEKLMKYLQQQEVLTHMSQTQLCTIAMDIGLFYGNFMKNQEVEIQSEQPIDCAGPGHDEQPSESTSSS